MTNMNESDDSDYKERAFIEKIKNITNNTII